MFAIVVLFVFVFHKHIVFVFLKDIAFADVGSVAPACYAQSVFTNTFRPRGGTRVVLFHMKIMIVMIMITTLMMKLNFEGCFTTAFVRLDVPREGLAMWLKRFSLSLQKQIQHSQLMSGDSHIKALGEFKIGEMKSK